MPWKLLPLVGRFLARLWKHLPLIGRVLARLWKLRSSLRNFLTQVHELRIAIRSFQDSEWGPQTQPRSFLIEVRQFRSSSRWLLASGRRAQIKDR
jgi:hypothetical protein